MKKDVWEREPVARYQRDAMEDVEDMWDRRQPVIGSKTYEDLEAALEAGERTGNRDANYPDLARRSSFGLKESA